MSETSLPFVEACLPPALQKISIDTGTLPVRIMLQGPSGCGKHMTMKYLQKQIGPELPLHYFDLRQEETQATFEKTQLEADLLHQTRPFLLCVNGLESLSPSRRIPLLQILEHPSFSSQHHFISLIRDDLPLSGSEDEDALLHHLEACTFIFPPLRERIEEVPQFLEALLQRELHFDAEALKCLSAWQWPGHVRELVSFARRLHLLNVHHVRKEHLPPEICQLRLEPQAIDLRQELLHHEMKFIEWAMEVAGGNQSRAAALLGLSRSSLLRRLRNPL